MSDLPSGWEWTTLYEVASWGSGGTPKRTVSGYFGGDVPWAVIGDLNDAVVTETAETITEAALASSSAKIVPKGAVLLAMYGSIGKLGMAGRPMATNQAIAFAVPHPGVLDARYLFHYLYSQRSALAGVGKGATQKNISQTVLKPWPLPLPPLGEQERIVAAIEEHLSRLDAADLSFLRIPSRLEIFRQVLLHEAFDERWPRVAITNVTDPARTIRYGILKPGDHVPDGVPVVKVRDYPFGEIQVESLKRTAPAIAEQFKGATLRPGDVLISIRGTYGRVAPVPDELDGANITQDSARIAPLPLMHRPFLVHFLRSPECQAFLQRVARGVAVKGVNIGDLRQLRVPVPDYEVQVRTAAKLDDQLTLHAHLSREVDRATRGSSRLRNSILDAAFSGQLVPQDRNDEPASVLLDRIRAERALAAPTKRTQKAKTS